MGEVNSGKDLLELVLRNVIGDPFEFIASGPTVYIKSTNCWKEAQSLLQDSKFVLLKLLPKAVVDMILTNTEQPPVSKDTNNQNKSCCETILIGNNAPAVNAMAETAKQLR